MINQQSARSTSSTKQHNLILSVTYQHDRLHLTCKRPQQRSQGPQQQQSKPPIFLQRVFPGKKNTKRCDTGTNACHSLDSSVDTVYLLLRVAQLNNTWGTVIFPLVFVSKTYSLFFGAPSPHDVKYVTDKKHVVCNRASLCVVLLVRTYITCTRVQTMPIRPNSRGRRHSQCCCVAFSGAVIVVTTTYYLLLLVLVMRALATFISMYVWTFTYRNSINKCTTMIPTAVRGTMFFFSVNIICFGTKYYANLEIMSCQVLFCQPLLTSRSEEQLESTVQNTKLCALFACLAQHPSAFTSTCWTDWPATTTTVSSQRNSYNHTTKRSKHYYLDNHTYL